MNMEKKDEEKFQKESQILNLLDKLNCIQCLESLTALNSLLAFPKDYFKEEDLKRLFSYGNQKCKSFVTLFLMKPN